MKFIYYAIAFIVWAVSWMFDVLPLGYSENSPLWTRFTYMFTHTGFFHLLLNVVTVDLLLHGLRRFMLQDLMLPIAMLGAVLATFGSEMALPTVGASGIAYFLMGVLFSLTYSKRVFAWAALVILVNVLMLTRVNANIAVHLLAGCYGALFGVAILIRNLIKYAR